VDTSDMFNCYTTYTFYFVNEYKNLQKKRKYKDKKREFKFDLNKKLFFIGRNIYNLFISYIYACTIKNYVGIIRSVEYVEYTL
jgi:hypothetical protein